ncbi:hypothetical protein Ocin01_10100, partial [Orchesella cincta]
ITGLVILAVGIFSYWESDWRKLKNTPKDEISGWDRVDNDFPPFSLELYFLYPVTICFILSCISLLLSLLTDTRNLKKRAADFGYHVLASIIMLIAGTVYISSSMRIKKLELSWKDGSPMQLLLGLKICAGVLGILVLIVGLISHYESHWRKLYKFKPNRDVWDLVGIDYPKLSIEEYYVAMVIISLIFSLIGTIVYFVVDLTKGTAKLIDLGYHLLMAFLLLIAGSLYISSAKRIGKHEFGWADGSPMRLLLGLKIFAGALTIIQTILYCVVAFFIWKDV